VADFKRDMDKELSAFRASDKVPGQERIYVAGEIEYEKTLANRQNGVPVHVKVWSGLEKLAADLDIPFELPR
jgi:LDH2 family malate/lactate/ureidoglycolate dehydrogenase